MISQRKTFYQIRNFFEEFINRFVHKPTEMVSDQEADELQAGCTVFNKFSLKEDKVDAFNYLSGKSSLNKTLIRLNKNHVIVFP